MSEQEKKEQKKAPWIRLASAYYRAENGEHPKLAEPEMFSFDPVLDEVMEEHLIDYDLPITPCIDGHNVMTTNSVPSFLNTNLKVPISPNFVRDLAGRIIYTGYGPEVKQTQEWSNNRHVTFPKGCRIVTTNIEGSEYIENIFLTRFRTLDSSISYENEAHQKFLSYEAENHYPYKLRLDTFYQDGWRLPQTNMLYARKSADQNKAKAIGLKFIEEWEKVQDIENYPEFIEKRGGNSWFDKLFQAGCTIIPTHEAYNSFFAVNSKYEIEKRHSGIAIQDLHRVLSEKSSDLPKGSIIEVVQPGFITNTYIQPAHVIISDGKRYEASKKAFPLRMHPDLRLPHQRTQSVWGATWIPSHPSHFDAPAIWGWDMATGHFLQLTGPLWDPLHYYYESTPLVIKAFKEHDESSKHIAYVPKEMKERFYPATAIKGFDMMSYGVLKMRLDKDIHPKSAILRVNDREYSATTGYNPLPYNYEFELNHLWFPELMPQSRTPLMPRGLNLVPVIKSKLTPEYYIHNATDTNEEIRLSMPYNMRDIRDDDFENYPHLEKYTKEFSKEMANSYGGVVIQVPHTTIKDLSFIYVSDDLDDIIEATEMPFYKAVKNFRSSSIKRLNKVIESFNGDVLNFIHKYWKAEG